MFGSGLKKGTKVKTIKDLAEHAPPREKRLLQLQGDRLMDSPGLMGNEIRVKDF